MRWLLYGSGGLNFIEKEAKHGRKKRFNSGGFRETIG
jgi:hypothetical protein